MKRLYFAVIAFFLAGSVTFGQMAGDIESLTPSDVNLFVKSREITRLIKTVNYMVFNLMDEKQRGEFITERNKFRDKTGIDYFDEKSLRNTGIDTSRPVSYANFDKDNMLDKNSKDDVKLLFIPVINEQEFPLKFIEIVKKANSDNPAMVITPVTALYKNVTVYQLKNDLFIAAINGYLVIGSTSDIIKRVLDIKEARNGSLILDNNYRDYLAKSKNRYDLNAFITKRFIMQMNLQSAGGNSETGLYSVEDFILAQGGMREQEKGSLMDSIDYISAGLGFEGNKFQMNAAVKLVSDNPYVDMIMAFLKTGVHDKSLYVPAADTTLFMSMNLKYLDNLCKGEVAWCAQYNAIKQQYKAETGIDVEKDFIPYFTGGMNIMALDSSAGGIGDILVFIPMSDSKKTEEFWLKLKKGIKSKYSKDKKFGEEKIGGSKGFWFIDETGMRFFICCDHRGIYAGNSTGLMKSALKSDTVTVAANTGRYGKIINDKTFFLLNIKNMQKNAFLKMLMQMKTQSNPDVAKGVNRIGEMFINCEKREGLISMDFEIEIKEPGKKK